MLLLTAINDILADFMDDDSGELTVIAEPK